MLVDEFRERYPSVFHMTRGDAWVSIKAHGLLSTEAICRKAGLSAKETQFRIQQHRPEPVPLGPFVLRDQKPLRRHNLIRNLQGSGLTPEQWYTLLNERVFFSTEKRFVAELRRSYIKEPVDVLEVDTKSLLREHLQVAELSGKNSGAARMPNHLKSRNIFQSIESFQFSGRCKPKELTVLYSVPNIRSFANIVRLAALEQFPTAD